VKAEYPNPTPMIYTGADDNITSRVVLDFGNIKVNIVKHDEVHHVITLHKERL
jgi:hypothetical protein